MAESRTDQGSVTPDETRDETTSASGDTGEAGFVAPGQDQRGGTGIQDRTVESLRLEFVSAPMRATADTADVHLVAERMIAAGWRPLKPLADLAAASGKTRSAAWINECATLPPEQWPPAPAYKGAVLHIEDAAKTPVDLASMPDEWLTRLTGLVVEETRRRGLPRWWLKAAELPDVDSLRAEIRAVLDDPSHPTAALVALLDSEPSSLPDSETGEDWTEQKRFADFREAYAYATSHFSTAIQAHAKVDRMEAYRIWQTVQYGMDKIRDRRARAEREANRG